MRKIQPKIANSRLEYLRNWKSSFKNLKSSVPDSGISLETKKQTKETITIPCSIHAKIRVTQFCKSGA